MATPLLSIATGVLKGAVDNRREKRQRDAQDLAQELELRSTPGVSLEPTGVRGAADAVQGLGGILGVGAGVVAPGVGAGGGQAPGESAGSVQLGGRTMDVRFDPSQTPAGRQAARDTANRAAHQALTKLDPTLWNQQYDPGFDYTEAQRDEEKKQSVEDQLVAAGIPREKARLYARTGIDADKRAAEIAAKNAEATRASRAAAAPPSTEVAAGTLELKKKQQTQKDATATAGAWAANGKELKIPDAELQTQIANALAPMYPDLSYAERVGVAAQAILNRDQAAATVTQKTRPSSSGSNLRGGLKIGGVTIDPSSLPTVGTPKASTASSSSSSSSARPALDPATKAKKRKALIDQMVDDGATKAEIKAAIKRQGLE